MFKSCSKCGKIHSSTYKCSVGRVYKDSEERKLRNTYEWQQKSIEIREHANYLCEVCRDEGRFNYNNLEVHHINKIKDAPYLLLDNYNLICLCSEHHKKADNNEIDKDYLINLAMKRENKDN